MRRFSAAIVGGGHAGAQAAIALRQRKFAGSIAIISDEADPPYERPPLSKDYLAGEKSFERIMIRPEAFWRERNVDLLLRRRVVQVEPAAKQFHTQDGEVVGYDTLIWAAGGRPRELTCAGRTLAGVHTLRTRADADQLMLQLPGVRTVCVIGGGYIGLEAAAIFSKLGRNVVLLEAQDRLLARVGGRALSTFLEAKHRSRGVDVQLNATVTSFQGVDGRVCSVNLAHRGRVDCDLVVVGIGIVPVAEPLVRAGARGGDGVRVDEFCRTELPEVFAIGDCALHAAPFGGGALIRVESVQNANDMAVTVAAFLTGSPAPYAALPWFWSNQFDVRLQTVGLSLGYDAELIRGDPDSGSFSIVYLRRGIVVALDCVNAPQDYVQGRALVARRASPSPALLVDPTTPLKQLVAA